MEQMLGNVASGLIAAIGGAMLIVACLVAVEVSERLGRSPSSFGRMAGHGVLALVFAVMAWALVVTFGVVTHDATERVKDAGGAPSPFAYAWALYRATLHTMPVATVLCTVFAGVVVVSLGERVVAIFRRG